MTEALTQRELEILSLIREGYTSKEISNQLLISFGTVSNDLLAIRIKLNAKSSAHALIIAIRRGLMSLNGGG